jgi:hypothetical protein
MCPDFQISRMSLKSGADGIKRFEKASTGLSLGVNPGCDAQ